MSIHFATPCYGGQITSPCFKSYWYLREALFARNIPHELNIGRNESLITRGRSEMARTFLEESDLERLMWIDADIEFTPEDVAKLWNLDADIAVGIYAMKQLPVVYAAWHEGKLTGLEDLPNPCEVDYAGTGFMMIKREVLEKIAEAYPELAYRGVAGGVSHLFGEEIVTEKGTDPCLLSDDYAFCRRWRKLGGKIMADPTVKLKHWGLYAYGS